MPGIPFPIPAQYRGDSPQGVKIGKSMNDSDGTHTRKYIALPFPKSSPIA
jgi:hypothetical protein